MNGLCRCIYLDSLSIAEAESAFIHWPLIFPLLLLSCTEVPMSFLVHLYHLRRILKRVFWLDDVPHTVTADCRETKCIIAFAIFKLGWPLIIPFETLSQGLSDVRCIFAFLDVVKPCRLALEILRLNNFVSVITICDLLSIGMACI